MREKIVKKKTFLKIAILTLFVFVPILALFTACGGNDGTSGKKRKVFADSNVLY